MRYSIEARGGYLPAAREAELIEEHQRLFGKPPRFNSA